MTLTSVLLLTVFAAHWRLGIIATHCIFAAEPLWADDAARSFAAGEFIPQTGPNTIADGLLTSLGDKAAMGAGKTADRTAFGRRPRRSP